MIIKETEKSVHWKKTEKKTIGNFSKAKISCFLQCSVANNQKNWNLKIRYIWVFCWKTILSINYFISCIYETKFSQPASQYHLSPSKKLKQNKFAFLKNIFAVKTKLNEYQLIDLPSEPMWTICLNSSFSIFENNFINSLFILLPSERFTFGILVYSKVVNLEKDLKPMILHSTPFPQIL